MGYKHKIKGESLSAVDVEKLKSSMKTILRLVRIKNRDGRKKKQ